MYPQKKGTIAPEIYGHFTEHIGGVIYDGIWVGKDSKIPNIKGFRKEIIEKLRAIKAPVIRWPGGCFAEIYDWRDAMVTALTLNIFNKHCDKIRMANVAQLVNNLHALFLARGEHCITTPTYHVFDMYKEHQGAESIVVTVTNNEDFESSVTVSASVKDNKTLITIGNLSCTKDSEIVLEAVGMDIPKTAEATLLYADDMHEHNTFESLENVIPVKTEVDISKPIIIPKTGILAIRF